MPDGLFQKIQDNDKTVDAAPVKQYLHCFLVKLDIQNSDGSFNEDVISKKLRSGKPLTDDEKKCLVQLENPNETALNFYKCFD